MANWQLQDAKERLDQVIEATQREGPQFLVDSEGLITSVVVPVEEWRGEEFWENEPKTMIQILRSGPLGELPIPPRGRLRMRKAPKF